MKEQRRLGHTVSWLTAHIVWVTKYRYHVLKGNITDEMVQEYLEHHRDSSNTDTDNIILEGSTAKIMELYFCLNIHYARIY